MTRDVKRAIDALKSLPDSAWGGETDQLLLIGQGEVVVDELIELCSSRTARHRYRAVWILGKIGAARSYETIVKLTSDRAASVAYDATMALGELGDKRAIPYLRKLRMLRDDRCAPATSALQLLGENVRPLRGT